MFDVFPGDYPAAESPEKHGSSSERSLTSHPSENSLEVSVLTPGKTRRCLFGLCVKAQLSAGVYSGIPLTVSWKTSSSRSPWKVFTSFFSAKIFAS